MAKAEAKKKTDSEQRFDQLKDKHGDGNVFMIEVPKDDDLKDFYVGFIKKPTRQTLRAAFSMQASDPLGANELVLRDSWIEGDEEIIEDDEVFFGAMAALQDLLQVRAGTLKKN